MRSVVRFCRDPVLGQ